LIGKESALDNFDLSCISLGDEGARSLGNMIETNRILKSLCLRDSSIVNEGACVLADALQQTITLKDLNLASNEIGNKGAGAIALIAH
jgi:Ran GTPase-activating protein (RanGAP) involved in mRNA processing and transport